MFEVANSFQQTLVDNLKTTASDGAVRKIGTNASRVTLTRNTAAELADAIQADRTAVKLNNIAQKGHTKISVAVC